ncbi:hypothetical protein C7N43_02605 [Sphingobacteriales bacterium UPWRP_1]|nr:hypothetical protein C7N43_02605 [Sphingobacteriales bacterium UPWRP_1]
MGNHGCTLDCLLIGGERKRSAAFFMMATLAACKLKENGKFAPFFRAAEIPVTRLPLPYLPPIPTGVYTMSFAC